jgi:ketosteroid isomerase-like protein
MFTKAKALKQQREINFERLYSHLMAIFLVRCSIVPKLIKINSVDMKVAQKVGFRELLQRLYAAFNDQDVDRALEVIHPDAVWANGMEGGLLNGHQDIREYWLRQWSYITWHVRPMRFEMTDPENIVVEAHQILRDLSGNIVSIRDLQHIFHIEDGLIKTMGIR